MQEFLKKLEETLKTYLKETYLPPHRAKTPGWTHHDLVFFARGADLLSTAFTEGRATLPKNYFNKKEFRSGFILYFFIPTFVKVWKCLEIGKDNGQRTKNSKNPRFGMRAGDRFFGLFSLFSKPAFGNFRL